VNKENKQKNAEKKKNTESGLLAKSKNLLEMNNPETPFLMSTVVGKNGETVETVCLNWIKKKYLNKKK
jgi:hypothetical protein